LAAKKTNEEPGKKPTGAGSPVKKTAAAADKTKTPAASAKKATTASAAARKSGGTTAPARKKSSASARDEVTDEMIATRAYLISQGDNAGTEEQNWLAAERELRGT
jgi:hypothetical protein